MVIANVSYWLLTFSSLAVGGNNEGLANLSVISVVPRAHSSLSTVIMVRGQAHPGWALEGEEEGKSKINFCCQHRFLQLEL